MSVEDKDNKEFEFIKEQVIQKKRKKIRKFLVPFFMTFFLAIIFGVIAAVTFCLAEPGLYRFIHREEEVRTPIVFPTTQPGNNGDGGVQVEPTGTPEGANPEVQGIPSVSPDQLDPDQVIVQSIEADISDYVKMSDEIKTLAYRASKALITVTSIRQGKDWLGYPTETVINSSGLIIYNDGTELTILVSYDRVSNASNIMLRLTEADTVEAKLLDYEKEINLAIITAKVADIPEIFLNNNIAVATLGESYTITVGAPALALGNPNGHTNSIDFGIITSKGSSINITDNKLDLFNTNMSSNNNSDGVVVNLKGEVIGVITRTLKSGINENLNTVLGISKIRPIIERMANKKPRIYCGVVTNDMTDMAKEEHQVLNGIYIQEVKANSPAFNAGLRGGDIIMMIDDKNVMTTNSFYNTISGYEPGSEVTLDIKRTSGSAKKEMVIKVILTEKKQD